MTCPVWPGVNEARVYLGFGKVGFEQRHPSAPRYHPSVHDKHVREPISAEPLVRYLFILLSYATLGLFIHLFICYKSLSAETLSASIPLRLFLYIIIILLSISAKKLWCIRK